MHRSHPRRSRAVFLAASAALAAAPRPGAAQTLEPVRFTGVPSDDLTPIVYALKNDLYKKAGLDLQFTAASSGSAATAAVVAGAYELGKGSLLASLAAHARGVPVVVAANGAMWDPKVRYNLMVVPNESPIKSAADAVGKTFGVPGLNDLGQLGAQVWLDKNGGDAKSMKWVEIPNAAMGAAVTEKRIDLGAINEPQLSAALAEGKLRVLGDPISSISEHFVFTVYFTNQEFATKHPETIRKFVRVTYEAAAYTNGHKAETIPLMVEATKMPLAIFQKIGRIEGATSSDPALIQPAIEAAAKYKNIARAFPAKELYFS